MRPTVILSIILLVLPFALYACSIYLIEETGPTGMLYAAPAATSNPDPIEFTVVVSSIGFNGTSGPFSIAVNQGDTVTIHFVYGDNSLSFDNPHRVFIDSYALTTGTIDRTTPIQTLTFTVGQAGQFKFHCDLPCFGMENLQQGVLVVRPHCRNGSLIPTGFSPLLSQVRAQRALAIFAYLSDLNDTPIAGVLVNFHVSTDFGQMSIGQNSTYSNGMAELTYTPGSIATLDVTASFAGTCVYQASSVTATLQLPAPSTNPGGQSPYISGQALIDTRLVGVQVALALLVITLGVIVVASLWSTIGYVFLRIFRISKADEKSMEDR
jgi:hypothetical protein